MEAKVPIHARWSQAACDEWTPQCWDVLPSMIPFPYPLASPLAISAEIERCSPESQAGILTQQLRDYLVCFLAGISTVSVYNPSSDRCTSGSTPEVHKSRHDSALWGEQSPGVPEQNGCLEWSGAVTKVLSFFRSIQSTC